MTSSSLVLKIANTLKQRMALGEIERGSHLSAQKVADDFQVSRSPARDALLALAQQGLLEQQRHRGFFVLDPAPTTSSELPATLAEPEAYYLLSEDWLGDRIPQDVTEQLVRERYGLTKAQASEILNRAASVGWAKPKPGYGWRLQEVAKTGQTLQQIYRMRLLIEPAGLLEPTFVADTSVLQRLKLEQRQLLDGGIETLPTDLLLATGMDFHEALSKLSGNPLYHMVLVQMNDMRRLLEYRAMVDRSRYYSQCTEHLEMIERLLDGDNVGAAELMKHHLNGALARKSPVLQRFAQGLGAGNGV